MKKIFVSFGVLALGLGAFAGLKQNKAINADASLDGEQTTALKAIMQKYIDVSGIYTKKSHIYLKTDTPDFETYFHAGATKQERTTYYKNNVLLMGDMDGGFDEINSGYANDGNGNMDHFTSLNGLSGLMSPADRKVDYTVTGKTMADYFFNLQDLIASIDGSDWSYDGVNKCYVHTISQLGLNESGDFKDHLLKKFQYFAAPMLLQTASHYLSYESIVLQETSGYLHIAINLSSSDSGKVSSGSNLLAEAMVYAGLVTPGYYLVGDYDGGKWDWLINSGEKLDIPTEGTDKAQTLNLHLNEGKYQICQLNDDGKTTWYNNVPQVNDYAFAEMDGNDIHIKYSGTYNIYLNASSEIYISRVDHKTATFTFNFVDSDWSAWNPRPDSFSLHVTTTEDSEVGHWGQSDERMQQNNTTYTYSLEFHGSVNGIWFYFYQSGAEKKSQNILGTLNVANNGSYTITCDVAHFAWADNVITSGISIA